MPDVEPTGTAPVLVAGATGKQGGATTRSLLAAGVPVRALVRDPSTPRARAVAALGAELRTGDLRDRDSVARAAEGARAVFSVQMPPFATDGSGFEFDEEVAQGVNLIEGAKAAGVPQLVHTSAGGVGTHTRSPGWADGRWPSLQRSLGAKAAIQEHLRAAGFSRWTLLKPGFFMENYLPSARYLFPRGIEGGVVSLLAPGTRLSLVAVRDIGNAAAAALTDPDRFHRVELELAGDRLTLAETVEVLARVLGRPVSAPVLTEEEAMAAGMPPVGAAHEWLNEAGQPGRPQYARDLGIPLTGFEAWVREHLVPAVREGAGARAE